MKKISSLLMAFALPIVCNQANAAMCINSTPSVSTEYRNAIYVVDAKVVRIDRDVRSSFVYKGNTYNDLVDRVTLKIIRSYKSTPNKVLTFDNPHDSAALPLAIGSRYVLFLGRNSPSAGLYVDTCGASGPLAEISKSTLKIITELSKPAGGYSGAYKPLQ